MTRTLLQKLTVKTNFQKLHSPADFSTRGLVSDIRHEMQLSQELSKELLSPRPEAISKILEMSRML